MTLRSWRITLASAFLAALTAAIIGCSESQPVDASRAVIDLSSHDLTFTAFVSRNPEPVRQQVYVTNAGEGELTFEAIYSAPWISLEPEGTDTIFVTVISDSLPVGEYLDTIRVIAPEAANSPQYITVHLSVLDWLATSPDTLFFNALGGGGNPPSDSIRVVKVGGGNPVSFEAATSASWLTLDNAQAVTPATITVNPDISSLTKGVFLDSVVIISDSLPEARAVVPCRIAISSWSLASLNSEVSLKGVFFMDDDTGWVSGFASSGQDFGFVYKTIDGGESWSPSPVVSGAIFGGITFSSPQHGWLAANGGRLFESTDGGVNWSPREDIPIDSSQALRRVHFMGSDSGWAIGSDGIIVRTVNGGTSWSLQATPTGHGLSGIALVDALTGWVSGLNGTILHTTNGGLAWTLQNTGTSADLRDISFISPDSGWAVGANGTVLMTSDGGATWTEQEANIVEQMWSVDFVNDSTGWMVGDEGLVMRTNDRGLSWMVQLTGTNNTLFEVVFRDENLGWTVGGEGTILKTASGGF